MCVDVAFVLKIYEVELDLGFRKPKPYLTNLKTRCQILRQVMKM